MGLWTPVAHIFFSFATSLALNFTRHLHQQKLKKCPSLIKGFTAQHVYTCLDTLLQLPNPTISALSIMLVRLLFWDSLAGSISRSLCPVITLITPQSFQPLQSLPVILIPNSLLGTITSPIALLSWWFFELPVHGGRCSLVALWGWYLPLKTDQIVPMVYVKKWPETTDLLFWGLFWGGLRLITKSLLMGASVHRLALLNALATPWHKALVSGPSGTGATSTTSATSAWDTPRVWWVDLRVGLGSVFFFTKKKRGKKGRKFWGKNGWSKFQGFFGERKQRAL